MPSVEPLVVRVLGGELLLDLLVVDDAPFAGVDQEHLAGLQPALADDLRRVDVDHADLRRHDHQIVVGHPVPARPQAVAVEHGADHLAVGERDARRAVPRLHHAGVELVERAPVGVHLVVVLPRLRDHHQHRVVQRTTRRGAAVRAPRRSVRCRRRPACRSGTPARAPAGVRSLPAPRGHASSSGCPARC